VQDFSCYTLIQSNSMKDHRHSSHTVSSLTAHVVCARKYRSPVQRDVQKRCSEFLIQICDSENVRILKDIVSKGQRQ